MLLKKIAEEKIASILLRLKEVEIYAIPTLNNSVDLLNISILHQRFIKMKTKLDRCKIFTLELIMILEKNNLHSVSAES